MTAHDLFFWIALLAGCAAAAATAGYCTFVLHTSRVITFFTAWFWALIVVFVVIGIERSIS